MVKSEKQTTIAQVIAPWLDRTDWFDELIRRAKAIEQQMRVDILKRYRECGQLLIEVGYKHDIQSREFLNDFMEAMNICRATVTIMLQLGRMNEKEFANAVVQYGSLHRFANKLPLTQDAEDERKRKAALKPKSKPYCDKGISPLHCCSECPYFQKKKGVLDG
jgi:hypothetical protein